MKVVVGADVGGSSTKVAVAQPDGVVRAVSRAPGANPNTVGPAAAATIIRTALDHAVTDAGLVDGDDVATVVVGLAGGSRVGDDPSFTARITPTGTRGVRVVSDLAVAFSSGTPADDGYVLVAGTGAVAGRLQRAELVAQRDGWGWLLGDEGAGFWIGRELVRSTLRTLELGNRLSPIQHAVLDRSDAADRTTLVQLCYAEPPVGLARLADLLSEHPDDPLARRLADRSADLLADLLLGLTPEPGLPVVLAGSVATAPGPVRERLSARLDHQLAGRLHHARAGVVGAVWTALRNTGVHDPAVHTTLVSALDG